MRLALLPRERFAGTPGAWSRVDLERPVPLNPDTVSKLAPACDDTQAALGVEKRGSHLLVVGLVRLGTGVTRLNLGDSVAVELPVPPVLEITCEGTGVVGVSLLEVPLGTLRGDRIAVPGLPVFQADGVVADRLAGLLRSTGAQTRPDDYRELVRRIVAFAALGGHGALVLVGGPNPSAVAKGRGRRLALADAPSIVAMEQALRSAEQVAHRHRLRAPRVAGRVSRASAEDARTRSEVAVSDARRDMQETIRLLATTAGVDGALCLDAWLRPLGFGLVVENDAAPERVRRAVNLSATDAAPPAASGRGHRHLAAAAFVAVNPDGVAFSVSQDGDISAWARVGAEVVWWNPVDARSHRMLQVWRERVEQQP